MTFEEIENHADRLKARLGATEAEHGLADQPITYGNYTKMRASYDAILNDVIALVRELATKLKPTDEPQIHPLKPQPGNFHD